MFRISKNEVEFNDPPRQLALDSDKIPPVPEVLIPLLLRGWIADLSERMQVRREVMMSPLLILVSILLGGRVGVCPKKFDNWKVIANLWGLICAEPGFMKSPIIAETLGFLRRIQERIKREYEQLLPEYAAKDAAVKAEIEGLKARIRDASKQGRHDDSGELEELLSL